MINDQFLSTLGLARRAGKITRGFESTVENIYSIKCLFFACDCSPRTIQNASGIFEEAGITPIMLKYSKNELGYAIGAKPVGIIGITDDGFAKLLKTKLSKEVTE